MTTRNSARNITALVAIAVGLSFAMASTRVLADGITCSPSQVELLSQNSSPRLLIQCNSVNYTAYTSVPSGCPASDNQTIDSIRILASLAQAALLSGKNVNLYYDGTSPIFCLYDVVLRKN
jgi:hypothetical protein